MVRPGQRDFLDSIRRRRIRPVLVLCIGAALMGGLATVLASAASASSPATPTPPPPTIPTPPPPTTPTPPPPTTPSPPPPTTPPTSATPRCTRAQLHLKFLQTQAATSHRFSDYAFVNAGNSACFLRGYPRVILVNKRGNGMHRTRAKVSHDPVSPVRTVVIKPGKRGFFTFSWAVGGACPGHTFAFYGLRVTPPGDHKNFRPKLSKTSACNQSATVTAVRPKLSTF